VCPTASAANTAPSFSRELRLDSKWNSGRGLLSMPFLKKLSAPVLALQPPAGFVNLKSWCMDESVKTGYRLSTVQTHFARGGYRDRLEVVRYNLRVVYVRERVWYPGSERRNP
jgi:hypothetical protein